MSEMEITERNGGKSAREWIGALVGLVGLAVALLTGLLTFNAKLATQAAQVEQQGRDIAKHDSDIRALRESVYRIENTVGGIRVYLEKKLP